jgi:hypothetical protein
MGTVLVDFPCYPTFEDGAAQLMMPQFIGIANVEQVTGRPGIESTPDTSCKICKRQLQFMQTGAGVGLLVRKASRA